VSLSPELEALLALLLKGHANRKRRNAVRRTVGISAALLTAAALGAAALAASNSWIFKSDHGYAIGKTNVVFHGAIYTVQTLVTGDGRSFNIGLNQGAEPLVDSVGHSWIRAPGVEADPELPNPPRRPSGQAVYGNTFTSGGGEIWFGIARPDIARVDLTDQHGHDFSTATVRPPQKYRSVFRFWVIAVPASHATTFTAYDYDGNTIQHGPLTATTIMSLY
jgi:hypothetical protein